MTYTIGSICPFPINESKPGMNPPIFILPESDGVKPEVLHIDSAARFFYVDESRGTTQIPIAMEALATSIVEDLANSSYLANNERRPGIFYVEGKKTSDEVAKSQEFKDAQVKQKSWFIAIAKDADNIWQRYKDHAKITGLARKVGALLGLNAMDHPWMTLDSQANAKRCVGCMSEVHPQAIICANCGTVLDSERYKTLQIAKKG